jgi:glycogen(starch) synthase
MRVLLLNSDYPPLGGRTAVAAETLARGLARRGASVDIVTAGERKERASEVHWDGVSVEEGSLTIHRVKSHRARRRQPGWGCRSYLRAALPLVRELMRAERYDVVHVFSSLPTGAILPFLDLRDTPIVVSLHGSDVPGYDPTDHSRALAHLLLRPLTRWIWRRADRVLVTSESVGRLALNTLPGLRYSVVHHGVDLTRFRPRAPHRVGPGDGIRCLAVSRLIKSEGLADLIRAIGSLEQERFELEILGSGPAEGSLRDLVSSLGLENRVTFGGSLDRDQIARRYRAADLFAIASGEEALDSGFAEALAAGLPIVGRGLGGESSLVHGRNGLLVPAGDPAALAGAILRLADDQFLRAKMARRNRAEAEANLSWDRVTARHVSIYQGIQRRVPSRSLLSELPSSTW